jgi:hypothetical protein
MKSFLRMMPLSALLFAPVAVADGKGESDECLRTKIWEGYSEGWAVRTATNTSLAAGEHKIYLVTLYAGNKYQFVVCGDSASLDIDLALHDAAGVVKAHDDTDSKEPVVTFTPDKTDTYYVAVYAQSVQGDTSNVAMAVTYQ